MYSKYCLHIVYILSTLMPLKAAYRCLKGFFSSLDLKGFLNTYLIKKTPSS
ncbi:hypothetical protein NB716_003965 [Pantoea ananatis]|nr:hypothetical protein [Pantoea ananatis]